MQPKPTLKTIAEASGFALTTVSRALAGDTKIALRTRQTIAGIAEDVGYIPDRAAQRLRTGRTNVISLVLSPHEEIFGFRGSMIAGLHLALTGTRYHISMTPYEGDADPLRPIRHIVRNRLADGIVFSGTHPQDERVAYLLDEGFPFVSHGRTELATPHPWCDFDNGAFAAMAVARLAARSRRRLMLIPPAAPRTYARHMTEGFRAACAAEGVAALIPEGATLSTPPEALNQLITALMANPDAPDGVICPGEVAAMAVMAALHDSGFAVGGRVDVIAKQTSPVFDQYRPRIDTIYEDIRAAGTTLGGLLLRALAGEPAGALQVLLSPRASFRLEG